MKIFFRHSHGWEFHIQREPMERERFYVLAALAAGALFVALLLCGVAIGR